MKQAWIQKNSPAIVLAPMEGVTDSPMRRLLTELCPFTHCVTEFLRISQVVPPPRVFHRHASELKTASRTTAGTPVIFQLLGGDPEKLAHSAQIAASLGAAGVDLNFGCPAPTVNRHDGGATLLKYPCRIDTIVRAVRAAVPEKIPVSVKMRLGWDDPTAIYENAHIAANAGAAWITIHGRTKTQGYQPPAYWDAMGRLQKKLSIPVIANGEIWTIEDFRRCREETGCEHFMIGRGALANPYLIHEIAQELRLSDAKAPSYPSPEDWHNLIEQFVAISTPLSRNPNYVIRRVKQWINYVNRRRPLEYFTQMIRTQTLEEFVVLQKSKNLFIPALR